MFRVRNIPAGGSASSDETQKNARIIRMGRAVAKLTLLFAFPAVAYACGLDGNLILKSAAEDGGAGSGGDAALGGDSGAAGDGGGGGDSGGGDGGDGGSSLPPTPVFAVSATALYELDTTNLTLKNLGSLSGCNDFIIDIAVTTSGNLYAITQNGGDRDVASLSMTGICSGQQTLDSSHAISIGYSGTAPANLLELVDDQNDLELLDPTNGGDTTLKSGALPGNALTDIACDPTKCWYIVNHTHCTPDPGIGGTCLFDMDPNGNGGAQFRPIASDGLGGLAYQGKSLYLFSSLTSKIHKIDLTNDATMITDVVTTGDPAPASWAGAGSTSSYP